MSIFAVTDVQKCEFAFKKALKIVDRNLENHNGDFPKDAASNGRYKWTKKIQAGFQDFGQEFCGFRGKKPVKNSTALHCKDIC